jgi:hypothetical protein
VEIDSQQGAVVIRFPKKSGHTISFPEVKRPQREAEHLPPSIAEDIKNWSTTSTPLYAIVT